MPRFVTLSEPVPGEEDLQDLYENAPCGYLSLRTDGRIFKANLTFCSWTDYEPDESSARSCRISSIFQAAHNRRDIHARADLLRPAHTAGPLIALVCRNIKRKRKSFATWQDYAALEAYE